MCAGDIVAQMCKGIENSDTAVVFITQRYAQKVASEEDDNCKMEFAYSVHRLGVKKMIPVVMEERMKVSKEWSGPLGFQLGRVLYVKMWEDSDVTGAGLERLIEEILKRAPAWRSEVKPGGVAPGAPAHSAAKGADEGLRAKMGFYMASRWGGGAVQWRCPRRCTVWPQQQPRKASVLHAGGQT